jgi:hypothetical protein
MDERPGVVQRAFQIARGGKVESTVALQAQLAAEGYLNGEKILAGRTITLQLTRMIFERRRSK